MAFIEKWDDKVTKRQSSNLYNVLIYSYFVNFATLPPQNTLSIVVGLNPTILTSASSRGCMLTFTW